MLDRFFLFSSKLPHSLLFVHSLPYSCSISILQWSINVREHSPEAEGILILLDSALALGSKLEAWVAAVLKKAALALADLIAWFPRRESLTAERVTRVMSSLLSIEGGEG
jgi:hypothetical protein